MSQDTSRYSFYTEWYDAAAALNRTYTLFYYPADKTIEMHDVKNRRAFLKRCEYPSVGIRDLFIGSTITVYARQLRVVDFADEFTRKTFAVQSGRSVLVIKPDAFDASGKILDAVCKQGFILSKLKMIRLTQQQAETFYETDTANPLYQQNVRHLRSDPIIAAELVSEDCVNKLRRVVGDEEGKMAASSLKSRFGTDEIKNAVHCSQTDQDAQRESQFFFEQKFETTARFQNCTCCIVKPHAVASGSVGAILDKILYEGYDVSAMELFIMDRPSAEEFLEVYKGVVADYHLMVDQLLAGPALVMEVCGENVVEKFREFCGPPDPEIGRHIRQHTLRAQYGVDRIQNAVHCTDLPEDGVLEVEYFFNILQQVR
eukprot:TRINITY_DN2425_c0_g1_i1.p1 TRINITY_DN2425_c0_g1~~TRINITY_DN2425_c0_g1_i1.p1  ORF type:complete len:405 (-),score=100.67 TRINITY_DN2425_c0_g1_i1:56-1171(-)